jgi:hypothetical protein
LSFLLILDEGGLREGWVKPAYSSLAATDRIFTKQRRTRRESRLQLDTNAFLAASVKGIRVANSMPCIPSRIVKKNGHLDNIS